MYKFDTHIHTSEISTCGNVSAVDTIKLYKQAGYSGLCITDHYTRNFFSRLSDKPWQEAVDIYISGYNKAKEYGDKNDFDVLLGAELLMDGSPIDYLLYGISQDFLYSYPDLYEYKMEDLRKIADENNILIFQAHPFRPYLTRENPIYLDGVEIFNGNPRHNSNNSLAVEFAADNNLYGLGGSDCHQIEDVGRSGIITKNRIKTVEDFINTIKSGDFEVIQC